MNILEEIIANKRQELVAAKKGEEEINLRLRAAAMQPPPNFLESLRSSPMGLIAEVKQRSPSAGTIREPFDAAAIAREYEAAGVQAISVLMDKKYFGGGESDFKAVRAAVKLPLLYKEFVVDTWQVWHAATIGASAVLLIASALDRDTLAKLVQICVVARMEPVVEVHTVPEICLAIDIGAKCIGINNRDLKTSTVSLNTTHTLAKWAPAKCLVVSESGIKSAADVARVKEDGAKAVLVGEQLLRQPDLGQAVRDLMGDAWARS